MNDLHQKILDENIRLHRIEAPYYDALHPEEFNWFEQARIRADLAFIATRLPKSASALDIGCGTGNIFLKLLDHGYPVLGVDISKEMLEVLGTRIPDGVRGRARLCDKNIDDFLSDCTEKFDLITISSVLHHLPDYLETLATALKLLNPGGCLYITHEPTKDALGPDRFLRKILWQVDNIMYAILHYRTTPNVKGRDYRFSDYHIYHGFNEERVAAECERRGLEILRFEKYSSSMRLGSSSWIDSRLLKTKSQFRLIAARPLNDARKDKT